MPSYEYRCEKCGHIFEEFTRSVDHENIKPCPKCGNMTEREIFSPGFKLSGKGFYINDYGPGKNNESDEYHFSNKKKKEKEENINNNEE
jgi:putative FmdB family regulatory protein